MKAPASIVPRPRRRAFAWLGYRFRWPNHARARPGMLPNRDGRVYRAVLGSFSGRTSFTAGEPLAPPASGTPVGL